MYQKENILAYITVVQTLKQRQQDIYNIVLLLDRTWSSDWRRHSTEHYLTFPSQNNSHAQNKRESNKGFFKKFDCDKKRVFSIILSTISNHNLK